MQKCGITLNGRNVLSWTEVLSLALAELARGASAMTSDDSARCLGDATTEYDYNYESHWTEKCFYYHDASMQTSNRMLNAG